MSFLFSVMLFSLTESLSVKWDNSSYLTLMFRKCPSLFKGERQKRYWALLGLKCQNGHFSCLSELCPLSSCRPVVARGFVA